MLMMILNPLKEAGKIDGLPSASRTAVSSCSRSYVSFSSSRVKFLQIERLCLSMTEILFTGFKQPLNSNKKSTFCPLSVVLVDS